MCCSSSFISINFQVFLGMVVDANKFKTREKEKLIEIKNELQHMQEPTYIEGHHLFNIASLSVSLPVLPPLILPLLL